MSSVPKDLSQRDNKNGTSLNAIGDYVIGKKLGEGTFSKVCQGIHQTTKEKVAIKIMSKTQIKEPSDKIRIEKEIILVFVLNSLNNILLIKNALKPKKLLS